MIQLARLIDPESRRIRQTYEQQVDEPQREAYGKIANARFAVYGSSVYPDATFTLRLAFGEVKGYTEGGQEDSLGHDAGRHVRARRRARTTKIRSSCRKFGTSAKSQLNLSTPFNFVSTADIIGGNSGSPVINRQGELVGIIFDGNIESLVLDYIYTDQQARAVAVHSAGILEALRKVYAGESIGERTHWEEVAWNPCRVGDGTLECLISATKKKTIGATISHHRYDPIYFHRAA